MSQTVKGRRSRVVPACVAKHWEHRVCSKITDNDYKLLNTTAISVNIMFFCTFCCSSNLDNGD